MSQLKQVDHSAQLLESIKSQLLTIVDDLLSIRIGYATRTTLESYTKEFEKKAQEERKLYIDFVEKLVKDIIKDEVKSLLPQILPKDVSDFATLVIQSTITESLENVMLAKSSSQPQSTYEEAASLTEFELKKILIDKLEKSKLYRAAEDHRNLYDVLIKSYQLDKDLFDSYGKAYSLKRSREDKDKDEDPPARPDQGLKKKKTSKDAKPSRGSKSKESKSSSSKGSKSQPKSFGKSVQAEEPVFETTDIKMPQDQGGDTDNQPNVEETPMNDWFKKPERPPTPNPDWNATKSVDSRPPQQWISRIAQAEKPPLMFDELMSTPIDFSAYVMHNLKIDNLTQEILVGPAFNLLKGTCKSFVELKYHFEECYKAVTDQLDWNNPEGHEYPFDLSKLLPLIKAQGRQVVPADYFFNNDLEYLKGGSASRKYTTSTIKTKAAKYDNTEGIEDMVLTLWSPVKERIFKKKAKNDQTKHGMEKTKSNQRSGYHQKDRKPSQNDKTEHGMEKTVQNQGQSPKMPKSESIQKNQQSNRSIKPEPELKNTIECNLNPSDGPGKPNSISMKTVKTKWALNQLQQPICVQLTKTVKTLKAQS
ncbi:hypothetical protein Tco_0710139 [Tanacetum coccineum]